MKKIALLAGSLALFAVAPIACAPPATAAASHIYHYAPDDGYDDALLIRCNGSDGTTYLIGEGESSTKSFPLKPDCGSVYAIYVRSNEEWWSRSNGVWYQRFDAEGWHTLPAGWTDGDGITLRRD